MQKQELHLFHNVAIKITLEPLPVKHILQLFISTIQSFKWSENIDLFFFFFLYGRMLPVAL